jgi:hypothetical protein
MKHFLFVVCVAVLLLTACQGQKSAGVEEEITADSIQKADTTASTLEEEVASEQAALPKAADELFDDFIFNFAANRKLQYARIKFPLKIQRGDEISYAKNGQWQMEYFFMKQDSYTLLFDS